MSEIAEIIDTLESKIAKLLSKVKYLEEINKNLEQDKKATATLIQNQNNSIELLKKDFESVKISNSLLGSEDYKKDTKLKINSLIREIDYCIAQLAN